MASRKCDSMIQFDYVPTITAEKTTITCAKTSFHVDIYETTESGDNELIGTASIVLSVVGSSEHHVDYMRVVTKYEASLPNGGSAYSISRMTKEELHAEHDEIVRACKELKEVWG